MCDTVVVIEANRVLFAKNSDCDPTEAQLLKWHPGASHAAGATVRCTWIEVPQVTETHAILISRPFWMWLLDGCPREHVASASGSHLDGITHFRGSRVCSGNRVVGAAGRALLRQ